MNWEAVGAIAEVAGVIGIVASLVFVGLQVRQNTKQLRYDNLREAIRGALDTNWRYHRDEASFDIFRSGCESFAELSPQEKAHYHSLIIDLAFYYHLILGMYNSGLIDSATLEVDERYFLGILTTPGGRQWWELVRQVKPFPDETIDHVQSLLDAPDRNFIPITELQPWFKR